MKRDVKPMQFSRRVRNLVILAARQPCDRLGGTRPR